MIFFVCRHINKERKKAAADAATFCCSNVVRNYLTFVFLPLNTVQREPARQTEE